MAKPSPQLVAVLDVLDEQRVRITPIRRAVLQVLVDHDEPLRVEDVYRLLGNTKADLVTVYRTLELFSKLGLVRPVRFHEDSARYELSAPTREHHHHFVCTACGKILDVEACLPETISNKVATEHGVEVTGHMLEFFGLCADCKTMPASKKAA
ncbi:MAG: transcriptional repressor [Candidatus Doudnabacteria bacterium]|nr:transcriptional repressor [Candidatus Doudnabacteria bacterium]